MAATAELPLTLFETRVSIELLDGAVEIAPNCPRAHVFREILTKLHDAATGSIPLREREIREFAMLLDCATHHRYAPAGRRALTRIYVKLRHAEPTEC